LIDEKANLSASSILPDNMKYRHKIPTPAIDQRMISFNVFVFMAYSKFRDRIKQLFGEGVCKLCRVRQQSLTSHYPNKSSSIHLTAIRFFLLPMVEKARIHPLLR
jgi:hypothetical protein